MVFTDRNLGKRIETETERKERRRILGEVHSHYAQIFDKLYDTRSSPYVWVTMLYGSQNYGVDLPDSDVDTRTIVLPSRMDIIRGKPMMSCEFIMKDGSLDSCKDLRLMFENYKKCNISFLETLFTDYYVGDGFEPYFRELQDKKDLIADSQPRKIMKIAANMVQQSYVLFNKPLEKNMTVLEKYGYDPKHLQRMARLLRFMEVYLETCKFGAALRSSSIWWESSYHDWIMMLRTNPVPYTEAVDMRILMKGKAEAVLRMAERLPEENKRNEALECLDDIEFQIMNRYLRGMFASYPVG